MKSHIFLFLVMAISISAVIAIIGVKCWPAFASGTGVALVIVLLIGLLARDEEQ